MSKKRRNFLDEGFWLDHYHQWQVEGVALSSYAKKNKLKICAFRNWKNRFSLQEAEKQTYKNTAITTSNFQEVYLKNEYSHSLSDSPIKFHFPNGCYLSFSENLAEDKLYRILANWIL